MMRNEWVDGRLNIALRRKDMLYWMYDKFTGMETSLFTLRPKGIYKTLLVNMAASIKVVAKPSVTSSPTQDQYLCKVTLDTPAHSVRNLGATIILTTDNQNVQ
jgi:hypothetical protein